MNEELEQEINDLKIFIKEELEDEIDYIREDYYPIRCQISIHL